MDKINDSTLMEEEQPLQHQLIEEQQPNTKNEVIHEDKKQFLKDKNSLY